ncbi:sulfotransferase 1C2-like [Scyliorhinus canicula]|uniref:sulfotransferase 1C2-like n=1 Tax=Scyliorhinus canicula TaxID=7830 RepID=UPI0018F4EA86|nr:sulfotransferase 1C2-like [Scyliorhinus canicula]
MELDYHPELRDLTIRRPQLKLLEDVPLPDFLADNWETVKNFQAKPDDLLIATYPKAGSTWMQEIVDLICQNGDVEMCKQAPVYYRVPIMEFFIDNTLPTAQTGYDEGAGSWGVRTPTPGKVSAHGESIPRREWEPWVARTPGSRVYNVSKIIRPQCCNTSHFTGETGLLAKMASPRMMKIHLPIQLVPKSFWEQDCKVETRDTTLTTLSQSPPSTIPYLSLVTPICWGFWYDHVKGWWEAKDKHRILFLFYEDIKENPRREILKVAEFMGKVLEEDVIEKIIQFSSFNIMKENPMVNYATLPESVMNQNISRFMRKGEVGDWKEHFTVSQNEDFDEHYERQMGHSSLKFRNVL